MTPKTVEQALSEETSRQWFDQVVTCEPALPPEDVKELADLVMDQERVGQQWRLTAVLASKEGEFFRDLSKDADKAQALAPTIDTLLAFAKLLRSVADLADCAAHRVLVAGCAHEHFNEWVAATDAQS